MKKKEDIHVIKRPVVLVLLTTSTSSNIYYQYYLPLIPRSHGSPELTPCTLFHLSLIHSFTETLLHTAFLLAFLLSSYSYSPLSPLIFPAPLSPPLLIVLLPFLSSTPLLLSSLLLSCYHLSPLLSYPLLFTPLSSHLFLSCLLLSFLLFSTPPFLTSAPAPLSDCLRSFLREEAQDFFCSQCHKQINRLEDLSTRLNFLEMSR